MPQSNKPVEISLIDKIIDTGKIFFESYINNDFIRLLPNDWREFNQTVNICDEDIKLQPESNLKHFYNFLCKLKQFKTTTLLTAVLAEAAHKVAEKMYLPQFGILNFIGLNNIITDIIADISAFNFSLYFEIEELSKIISIIEEGINQCLDDLHIQINIAHQYAKDKTTSLLSRVTKRTQEEINTLKHLLKTRTKETLITALHNNGVSLVKKTIQELLAIEKKYYLQKGLLTKKFDDILIDLEDLSITPEINLPRRSFKFLRWITPLPGDIAKEIIEKIIALSKERSYTQANSEEQRIISAKINILCETKQALVESNISMLNNATNNIYYAGWSKTRSMIPSKTFRLVQAAHNALRQSGPVLLEKVENLDEHDSDPAFRNGKVGPCN